LTAANDIYTFPNYVTYDGTSNGYDTGIHLKVDTSSNLVLAFTGGDKLHSDTYSSQVSLIQYKTGSSGSLVTVPSADVTINSATGHEKITLANIVATAVDDVYVNVTLKGPDGAVMSSPLVATVSSGGVAALMTGFRYIKWSTYEVNNYGINNLGWGAAYNHIRFYNSVGDIDYSNPKTNAFEITTYGNEFSNPDVYTTTSFSTALNNGDTYPDDFEKAVVITNSTRGHHEDAVFRTDYHTSWSRIG
jgi:hypothetical protein